MLGSKIKKMKKNYINSKKGTLLYALMAFSGISTVNAQLAQTTTTFSFTGGLQTFTVPQCSGQMTIEAVAAAGGDGGSVGASGGYVSGVATFAPGTVLYINVGGKGSVGTGGFNGGGAGGTSSSGTGSGGGGATDVRIGGNALANRIIVAGGGGGGGNNNSYTPLGGAGGGGSAFSAGNGYGGAGSVSSCGTGANGGDNGGSAPSYGSGGAGGGFNSGGGGGGFPSASTGGYGCPGTLGAGGDGGGTSFICGGATGGIYGAGGGGGGYYGGGGGMTGTGGCHGGGGGGSSWSGTLTSPTFSAGVNPNDGYLIISYSYAPPSLNIAASSSTVCATDAVTLTVSGSTSYTWDSGSNATSIVVTPTSNSTYSVVGTGTSACLPYGLVSISVIQLPNVVALSSANFTVCPSTQVTLNGSGASSYIWSNNVANGVSFAAPNATTIYTVTGTDSLTGCSNTNTAVVSVYDVSVGITPTSATVCSGGTATLTGSSANSYSWSPGNSPFQSIAVSPLAYAVFTLNVLTADFCIATNTVAVTVLTSPTVIAIASQTNICKGESVTLNASGAASFSWSEASTTPSISVSPTISTVYSVVGTDANNCKSVASNITILVEFCTGINSITSNQSQIAIFPNPNNGVFTIKSNESINLNVINELGQIVKSISLTESNNNQVSISGLSNGIYFLVGQTNSSKINQKIVVTK